jgi:protein involved in polysaccharide export with SLBB domain
VSKSAWSVAVFVIGAFAAITMFDQGTLIVDSAPAAEAVGRGAATPNCAPGAPAAGDNEHADSSQAHAPTIQPGDRVRLAFYEVLQSADDKWGANRQRMQEPAKGVQLRAELSHEYIVREDGTISIPILGTFLVGGRKTVDPLGHLECAFDAFLGKQGFVNVLSVEKQPIYVVGKVKNSGGFDYTPGMTVLHAIALAGGFDKATIEPWQIVDMTRGSQQLQHALDRAARMIARATAIEAARSAEPPKIPDELSELVGEEKAERLVSEELVPRRLAMNALAQDEKALQTDVDSASSELELRKGSLPLLEQSIALRQDRIANLQKLADSGGIGRPVLIQAQSELLDVESRRQETMNSINVARDRLNKALGEQAARRTKAALAHQTDLATARQEATKEAADGISASKVIEAIAKTELASASAENADYFIIRRSNGASTLIRASETTQLEPGDLVQVRSASGTRADVAINSDWSKRAGKPSEPYSQPSQ